MTSAPLRVGVTTGLWIWREALADRRLAIDRIADAGIDHVFFADHVSFHDGSGKDGMVQATAIANLHGQLGIYAGVYLLALRHPVTVARQICDVAQMAPGRFTFGVGVGGEDPAALQGAAWDEVLSRGAEDGRGDPAVVEGTAMGGMGRRGREGSRLRPE